MYRGKHVLLLTSTNLACNPRCLKEVRLLLSRGAKVTLVAFHLYNWSDKIEKELTAALGGVDFNYLETTKKELRPWLVSSLLEKMARMITGLVPGNTFWAAMAVSKRSWLLLQWVKQTGIKPDLIIAHNPAAFYPAYRLAKKNKIPVALDVEDYHPGESTAGIVKKAVSVLMNKIIPQTAYTSFASPLIKEQTENLLDRKNSHAVVINNFFPGENFVEPAVLPKEKLQLVWFSQNIDFGRGLEELLEVFPAFEDSFHLTLIGNPKEPFISNHTAGKKSIAIMPSLSPEALTKMMAQFDIGLAIEPAKDLNNTLALSNKILTYFQAGLFIVASDTPAQQLFMNEHPQHGICTSLIKEKLYAAFSGIRENMEKIKLNKINRFKSAQYLNWENESVSLLNEWNRVLC